MNRKELRAWRGQVRDRIDQAATRRDAGPAR